MSGMTFEIARYTADRAAEWNQFVTASKNGTFLFDRNYMDYHSHRFSDHSLMVGYKGRLYALLPANVAGDTLFSHQGLTYGGLVMAPQCRTAVVRDIFAEVCSYLRGEGLHRVVYKPVPWIYASLPAAEDLFALTNCCRATISSRDVASVVDLSHRLPLTTLRRRGVSKARSAGLSVRPIPRVADFWPLLEQNLMSRHQAHPVHSLEEMQLLAERFPMNISLYGTYQGTTLIGGTVLYVTDRVVKTQYISANEQGRKLGALDLLFHDLLDHFADRQTAFFDFGTSNLPANDDLNDTLVFQKEGFGARAVCYDTYQWTL